jgi:protein phosphatase
MPRLEIFGHTHIGRKRASNQDSYLALEFDRMGMTRQLLAVADGMGGHAGGDVASETAITTLRESVLQSAKSATALSVPDVLKDAVRAANAAVFDMASTDDRLHGMGTTVVAALAVNGAVTIANVGDSRAYLIHNESIRRITADHAWEEEAAARQELSPEEIAASPFRGMVTRSLGVGAEVEVDLFQEELEDGQYLFLCSDGVHRYIEEGQIRENVTRLRDPESICHQMIELANQAGGSDNITCVVARHVDARVRPDEGQAGRTRKIATPHGEPL